MYIFLNGFIYYNEKYMHIYAGKMINDMPYKYTLLGATTE